MSKNFFISLIVTLFSILIQSIKCDIFAYCHIPKERKDRTTEQSQVQIIKQYDQDNSETVSLTEKSETKRIVLQKYKKYHMNIHNNNTVQDVQLQNDQLQKNDLQENQLQKSNNPDLQEHTQNTSPQQVDLQSNLKLSETNQNNDISQNQKEKLDRNIKPKNQEPVQQEGVDSAQNHIDLLFENNYGYGNFIVQKFFDFQKDKNLIENLLQLRGEENGTQNYVFCRIENEKQLYIVMKEQRQNMENEINQIKFEDLSEQNKLKSIKEVLKSLQQINKYQLTHKNIHPERIFYNENRLLPLQLDITDQIVQQDKNVLILHAEIQPPEYPFLSQHQIREQQMIYCYGITIVLMLYGKKQIEQLYQIDIEEINKNQNDETQLQILHSIYKDQLKQKNYFPKAVYSPGFFQKIWFHIKKFLGFKTQIIIFNFRELIMQMISIDPFQRPSFTQVDEKLQQFLSKYKDQDNPLNEINHNVLFL